MKTSASLIAAVAMVLATAQGQTPAPAAGTPSDAAIAAAPAAVPVATDRQMQAVLDELASMKGKPIETLTAEEARRQPTPAMAVTAIMQRTAKSKEEVGTVADRNIWMYGRAIPARIYTPVGDGPFPIILYVHGGGWVLGDLDSYDASPRALANAVGAVVVSTDYRHAPESKFPAAHEDVANAYEWCVRNGGTIRGDVNRIAVAGESAGGNMAMAVTIYARERGLPNPVHQLLIYPVGDMTGAETPSYKEFANARPLNRAMMAWFARQTLAKASDANDPRISPIHAGDALAGFPPTTIINAEIDPLCSDGEILSALLSRAGVKVHRKVFPGVTHEFFGMGAVVDQARNAVQFAAADLRAAFERVILPAVGEGPGAAANTPPDVVPARAAATPAPASTVPATAPATPAGNR